MKAAIVFTGGGPVLFLTSCESLDSPLFVDKLCDRGISRFMAYEVPMDEVKKIYGAHFGAVINDVRETDDLRCLDYNGFNVFRMFSLTRLKDPVIRE